jgi:hypothetical protein
MGRNLLLHCTREVKTMKKVLFVTLLLSVSRCIPQTYAAQPQTAPQAVEKAIEWINIRVPVYPPIARTAHIAGTVAIQISFKGCELDPSSLHVVSGPPLLRQAALDALKQPTIRCGNFSDDATIYYDFELNENGRCDARISRLEQTENHIRVFAPPVCVEADQN